MQIPGGSFIMIMDITIMNTNISNTAGTMPNPTAVKIFSQNIDISLSFVEQNFIILHIISILLRLRILLLFLTYQTFKKTVPS